MGNFRDAIEKLIQGFDGFTDKLRDMADELPQDGGAIAGAGEEAEDYDNVVHLADAPAKHYDLDDDTMIQMRSGDLRKVLNAYRKMTRWAREGKIPTQDERVELHQHIRKVKHLVRKPHHHAA